MTTLISDIHLSRGFDATADKEDDKSPREQEAEAKWPAH